jgi:hypothetical protein
VRWTGGATVVGGGTSAGRLVRGVLVTGATTGALVAGGRVAVGRTVDGATLVSGDVSDGAAALEVGGGAVETGVLGAAG